MAGLQVRERFAGEPGTGSLVKSTQVCAELTRPVSCVRLPVYSLRSCVVVEC